MNRNSFFAIINGLILVLSPFAKASTDLGIGELEFGHSRERTVVVLEQLCDQVDAVSAKLVQFPLAAEVEKHIRCSGLRTSNGVIEQSVFVIADNSLVMIEMHGGAIKALVSSRTDEPIHYMHYSVLDRGQLFADLETDTVWLLSEDALHPNLFTWSNPYLNVLGGNAPVYETSAQLPDFIQFGATLKKLRPLFEYHCPIMSVETIDQVWLPNGPSSQTQINCFGIEYAGFPRKIEAVFGDDQLELLWILTAKPEEGRVRETLISAFGQPDKVEEEWDVFDGGKIALRKDKPEILAISHKLIPHYFKSLEIE